MKKHIPNLLTLGNLFCGFLSIGYVANGDIRNASILIFIAMMLDAVDGRGKKFFRQVGQHNAERKCFSFLEKYRRLVGFVVQGRRHIFYGGLCAQTNTGMIVQRTRNRGDRNVQFSGYFLNCGDLPFHTPGATKGMQTIDLSELGIIG